MQIQICATCHITNDRKLGRVCSSCDEYHHLSCVKLTQRYSSSISQWQCRSCLPLTSSAPPRQADPFPTEVNDVLRRLGNLRVSSNIPKCIPKSARILAADVLSSTINSALEGDNPDDWSRLLFFAPVALGVPVKSTTTSLASQIREQSFFVRLRPVIIQVRFPSTSRS